MKILVVMGTRPEVIKLAPVVTALRRRKGLETLVCATGQHRELLDQTLEAFGLQPDFDFDLMRREQSPDAVARRVLEALSPLLTRIKPDLVIVQGDTTTALAAALCAYRRRIPVAHVEAGLRSFNPASPFPEERNRVVIDQLASLHFAPTPQARANLAREGLKGPGVFVTGNTIIDSILWAASQRRVGDSAQSAPAFARKAGSVRGGIGNGVAAAPAGMKEVLVTLHRRESFGRPLKRIFKALISLVKHHTKLVLVYPVHPNPQVHLTARRWLRHPRIHLIKPLPYLEFLRLMNRVYFLITDSGGIQEESVGLHKPVLVVRAATERPEIVVSGAGKLVGLDPRCLSFWVSRLLKDKTLHRHMSGWRSHRRVPNPYGDGQASRRIASAIARWQPNHIRSKYRPSSQSVTARS